MTESVKMEKLEELLEVDQGVLTGATVLNDLDTWDSITKLSLIILMDEEFGVTLTGEQVKELISIQDILNLME